MKKLFLVALLATISSFVYAQKLAEDEVDRFTGTTIKRTSWETFNRFNKKHRYAAYFRVTRADNLHYFQVKMMFQPSRVFSIKDEAKMMFILDDGSMYEMIAVKGAVSSVGAGAIGMTGSALYGTQVSYHSVDDEAFDILKDRLIKEVRIYTTDGYVGCEMNEKDSQVVKKAIELIK